MRHVFLAISLLLFSSSAAQALPIDHESLTIVGWNKDCSVAFSRLYYPVIGAAIAEDPVKTRLGTLTITPDSEKAQTRWLIQWDGGRTWNRREFAQSLGDLKSDGYVVAGWRETIRPEPVVEARDLPRLLLTTDTFKTPSADLPEGFPGRWRLTEIRFSSLHAACALMVFEDSQAPPGKPSYDLRLMRVTNPSVRQDRALAHATNGLLLLERGDRAGALAETGIAARLAPDYALARYQYSRMLAISGQQQQALDELEAAVSLDDSLKKKARGEENFSDLAWMPRFKELIRKTRSDPKNN